MLPWRRCGVIIPTDFGHLEAQGGADEARRCLTSLATCLVEPETRSTSTPTDTVTPPEFHRVLQAAADSAVGKGHRHHPYKPIRDSNRRKGAPKASLVPRGALQL